MLDLCVGGKGPPFTGLTLKEGKPRQEMRNVKWWEEANTSTSTKPVLVQMTRQRV